MSTPDRIEADNARTREELKVAVDQLAERLHPRTQANDAMNEAKIAVEDLKRRVTGEVRRPDEPEASRTGWVVLGTAAALTTVVLSKIIKRL